MLKAVNMTRIGLCALSLVSLLPFTGYPMNVPRDTIYILIDGQNHDHKNTQLNATRHSLISILRDKAKSYLEEKGYKVAEVFIADRLRKKHIDAPKGKYQSLFKELKNVSDKADARVVYLYFHLDATKPHRILPKSVKIKLDITDNLVQKLDSKRPTIKRLDDSGGEFVTVYMEVEEIPMDLSKQIIDWLYPLEHQAGLRAEHQGSERTVWRFGRK